MVDLRHDGHDRILSAGPNGTDPICIARREPVAGSIPAEIHPLGDTMEKKRMRIHTPPIKLTQRTAKRDCVRPTKAARPINDAQIFTPSPMPRPQNDLTATGPLWKLRKAMLRQILCQAVQVHWLGLDVPVRPGSSFNVNGGSYLRGKAASVL